jgi:hypothetical protein
VAGQKPILPNEPILKIHKTLCTNILHKNSGSCIAKSKPTYSRTLFFESHSKAFKGIQSFSKGLGGNLFFPGDLVAFRLGLPRSTWWLI